MYYSLWDLQNGGYMATGLNSKTKEQVKEGLLSYYSADHDEKSLKSLSKMTPDEVAEHGEFEIHEHKELIEDETSIDAGECLHNFQDDICKVCGAVR